MKPRAYNNHSRGFTLVEMLVYIAIFMIVAVATVGFLLSLRGFIDQYRLETILYRSGTNAMEQILLAIRQADTVDLLNTTEDNPAAGRLTLDSGATTTEFVLSGDELLMEINSTPYGNVLSDAVSLQDFTVYYYETDGRQFVRVRLTMSGTVGTVTKTSRLYGGAVVRGAI